VNAADLPIDGTNVTGEGFGKVVGVTVRRWLELTFGPECGHVIERREGHDE
jgi:hypothetical protein